MLALLLPGSSVGRRTLSVPNTLISLCVVQDYFPSLPPLREPLIQAAFGREARKKRPKYFFFSILV